VIKKRKQKNEWKLNMTFQDSWAKNFSWVELFKSRDGNSFMMCCKIYTIIEHWENLFILKLDGLGKHNDRKMCQVVWPNMVVGKSFIDQDSQHVHNENIYYIIGHDNIWLKVVNHDKLGKKHVIC
jgi:hypothetical protein